MASIPSSDVRGRTVDDALNDLSVDGLMPASIVEPRSPINAARLLADAREQGSKVVPVGGATSLALGNEPERIDIALSTGRLSGVLSYEPTDLTLSVMAGTPFAVVQALLGEQGQTLPVDVSLPEAATIGGMIATGIFGPRRTGSPTFRDLLIGVSAAHPTGDVTKAGGMVVKNVSGFDLMRLYLGSLGTLGLVVSANFKVLPLARAETTVFARYAGLDDALSGAGRVHLSRVRPTCLEVFEGAGAWHAAVRIEGRESTVRLLAADSIELLHGDAETWTDTQSIEWWQRYTDAQAITTDGADALIRASVRPRATTATASELWSLLSGAGVEVPLFSVSPAIGQLTFRIRFPEGRDAAADFTRLHASLMAQVDHLVVLAAPPHWKRQIDVWGRSPNTIDVMRALKREFDPENVLNPGRYAGRI
ncbi:MAG: FAD-binding oxidoreductase [Thermomicrobiales bacterium]